MGAVPCGLAPGPIESFGFGIVQELVHSRTISPTTTAAAIRSGIGILETAETAAPTGFAAAAADGGGALSLYTFGSLAIGA